MQPLQLWRSIAIASVTLMIVAWTYTLLKENIEAADAPAVIPGSIDDPVVTKGYVDEQIATLTNSLPESAVTKQYVDGEISGIKSSYTTKAYVDGQIQSSQTALASKTYVDEKLSAITLGKVVSVPLGKRLVVTTGTEMVVRSGKAVVYSKTTQGLSDLTTGTNVLPNTEVINNHLLLSPAIERGIKPASTMKSGSLIVFVKGVYKIE